jgi:hypothetical protein
MCLEFINAYPLMLSAMAFSALTAFWLDWADAVIAPEALELFPVRKT